jgi:hypothetical protein
VQRGRGRDGGGRIVGRGDIGGIGIDRGVESGSDIDIGQEVGRDTDIGADMTTRGGKGAEVRIGESVGIGAGAGIDVDREGRIESQDEMTGNLEGILIEGHVEVDLLISGIVEGGETKQPSSRCLSGLSIGVWSYFARAFRKCSQQISITNFFLEWYNSCHLYILSVCGVCLKTFCHFPTIPFGLRRDWPQVRMHTLVRGISF